MLTKKEVTNWVYRVRDKAFRSLQDAYEKAVSICLSAGTISKGRHSDVDGY